jgi:hypothetical protein
MKNLVLILLFLFLFFLFINKTEGFDSKMVHFVSPGNIRYGLRGDMLKRSDISRLYKNNNRHIALNPTSGQMWMNNIAPNGCKAIDCPNNNYDTQDTCHMCGSF